MRRTFWVPTAFTAFMVGFVAVSPSASSAEPNITCNSLANGKLCIRTESRDSHHISGADISYQKSAGGCITLRFGHRIENKGGATVDTWYDDGQFSMCANETRTYYWRHAGDGAYVPNQGTVVGFMEVDGQGTFTTNPAGHTKLKKGEISYELNDAWKLFLPTNVPPDVRMKTSAERQVLSWLQEHRSLIVEAETRWKVDRRAIAGAIAWEALENVKPAALAKQFGKGFGPGKVHYAKGAVGQQVEDKGYLPHRSEKQRKDRLGETQGAIEYIGAILSALSDVAEQSQHSHNMRCEPAVLTTAYHNWDLNDWKQKLADKPIGEPFSPGGDAMGAWVQKHTSYLAAGVGIPGAPLCGTMRN